MRQKNVIWIVVLVVAAIVVTIATFAVVRRPVRNQGYYEHTGQHHHESQKAMTSGENHHTENSVHHSDSLPDMQLSGVIEDGQRIIDIKARRFEFDPNRIVVKKGETVRLEVTSEDVAHGIDIEGYGINERLDPNKTETVIFTADRGGHFHCSVYCGKGHPDMHGELVVIGQD